MISINLTKSEATGIFPSAEAGTAVSASQWQADSGHADFYGGKFPAPLRFSTKDRPFWGKEPALLQNISKLLGVASTIFCWLDPKAKGEGAYLVSQGLILQEEMGRAKEKSRVTKEPPGCAGEKIQNQQKEDSRPGRIFWQCKFVSLDKKNAHSSGFEKPERDYLIWEVWVPLKEPTRAFA